MPRCFFLFECDNLLIQYSNENNIMKKYTLLHIIWLRVENIQVLKFLYDNWMSLKCSWNGKINIHVHVSGISDLIVKTYKTNWDVASRVWTGSNIKEYNNNNNNKTKNQKKPQPPPPKKNPTRTIIFLST